MGVADVQEVSHKDKGVHFENWSQNLGQKSNLWSEAKILAILLHIHPSILPYMCVCILLNVDDHRHLLSFSILTIPMHTSEQEDLEEAFVLAHVRCPHLDSDPHPSISFSCHRTKTRTLE